jgi:cytochrome c-type biogenesis protein CcmF
MEFLGKALIWLATVGIVAAVVLYLRGDQWRNAARWAFRGTAACLVSALILLLFLILTHRYEFHYVQSYSSSDLPIYYLIACLWGGQEGTLLLWIFYVSLMGLILMRQAGRFEKHAMSVLGIFIFSILLILLKRSPFATTSEVATEGAGLNPLLQDFWMTIHPPIMFFGFALSVFPFAMAVAGWIQREYKAWTSVAWVWLLGTWCTLGTALVMGGYWAYKVLGWGGYWAWDPVENSSLIPWLFATGGLHSMVMFRKKNSLARSAYFFSILPFIAVLFGSFLTRSGVLGDFSVHSFLDLGINSYLVSSLGIFLVLGLGVLFLRYRDVRATVAYGSMATVDFLVSVGVLSFLLAGVLVLIGMSTPLWSRLFGPPSNVTLRYYFLATTPIALILLASLSVFPFMRWIKPTKPFISHHAALPFTFAMLVGGVAIFAGVHEPLYILLLVLGGFAAASNAWLISDRVRTSHRLPGAYVAHVGLAVLLVGAAVSTAYERKVQIPLKLGEPVEQFGWTLTYQGKDMNAPNTPYHVLVEKTGSNVAYVCSPRQFELPYGKGVMRKPAVKKFWNKDLYISPVDEVAGGETEATAFTRGETHTISGYDFTFLGFQMGGHGEGQVGHVGCAFQVTGDMLIDTLTPAVESTPEGMKDEPVQFADSRFTLSIGKIDAAAGKVELKVADRDHPADTKPVFWIEFAEKPLINLLWGGTMLMVFGGLLTLRKRSGQLGDTPQSSGAPTAGEPSTTIPDRMPAAADSHVP